MATQWHDEASEFGSASSDLSAMGPALKALAAKLSSASSQSVKLTNYQNKVVHVKAYTKTVDGKIVQVEPYTKTVKSQTGSGPIKAKQGVYTVPGHKFKSGQTAEYSLDPGDKVYSTHSGNLVKVSKSGKTSGYSATPSDKPTTPFVPSSAIDKAAVQGVLDLVDESPEEENDTPSTGAKIDTDAVLVDVGGGHQVALGPEDVAYKVPAGYVFITIGGTPAVKFDANGEASFISAVAIEPHKNWIDKYGSQFVLAKGAGSAGPQKDNDSSVVPDVVKDGFFVHPQSNVKVKLNPGDVLWNHKTSSLSWQIIHPDETSHKDGKGTFIGKNGKPIKSGSIALKAIQQGNYNEVYTVPAEKQQGDNEQQNLPEPKIPESKVEPAPVQEVPEKVVDEPVVEQKPITVNVSGYSVVLAPGQKIVKAPTGSTFVVSDKSGEVLSLYGKTGLASPNKINYPAWKSFIKSAGPEFVVAENPVVKPTVKKSVAKAPQKPKAEPWSVIVSPAEAKAALNTAMDRLYTIGDLNGLINLRDDLARDVETLAQTKQIAELDSVQKKTYTQSRNRLALLVKLADAYSEVKAGNLSPELATEFSELFTKMSSANVAKSFGAYFPIYVTHFFAEAQSEYKQQVFKASLPNLGFDLYNGTESDYQEFASKNGFQWAGGLTQDLGKSWAQLHLGDPTISGYSLGGIETLAKKNLVIANAKIHALKSLENLAPKPVPVAQNDAIVQASLAAVTKKKQTQVKNLYKQYSGKVIGDDSGTYNLTHVDSDAWEIEYQDGSSQELTDAEALNLVQMDKNLKPVESSGFAYAQVSVNPVADFESKLKSLVKSANPSANSIDGLSPSQLNKVIKSVGGNYVGKMDQSVKKQWLLWHAAGFPTATYALEDQAVQKSTNTSVHVIADSNPGSWDSPQGKQAWQMLADKIDPISLEIIKNGGKASELSDTQLDALITSVGLQSLLVSKDTPVDKVPYSQKILAANAFMALHKDHLPKSSVKSPQPAPSMPQAEELAEWEKELLGFKGNAPDALPEPDEIELPPAPAGVDEADWSLVVAVAKGNITPELQNSLNELIADVGIVESKVPYKALAVGSSESNSLNPAKVLASSLEMQKLVVWATSSMPYVNGVASSQLNEVHDKKKSIKKAVFEALKQDLGVATNSSVWQSPDGASWSVPPGGQVYKAALSYGSSTYYVVLPDVAGFSIDHYGDQSALSKTDITTITTNSTNFTKVFEVANPLTHEDAQKEIGSSALDWETVEQAEKIDFSAYSLSYEVNKFNEADVGIGLKAAAGASHPKIAANIGSLPPSVQKLALYSYINEDSALLDLIQWKIGKGHYDTVVPNDDVPVFPPESAIGKALAKGHLDNGSTLYANVSGSTLDTMATEAGLNIGEFFSYLNQANAIVEAVNAKLSAASGKKDSPASQELVLKKTSKSLSGMHSKIVWADQHGNEWMSKGFPNDPNGPARVDAEHYSNVLARLHGFRAPDTRVMTLEGKYSYVQLLKPAQGDLTSKSLTDLSDEQLADAMAEHVLDWVVSNHDSNPQNIMIDSDGRVFGIDKGQAFRFFPDDKLAYGYLPPSNPASVFYDKFYAAILQGSITKERADKIAASVLDRAYRMQTRNNKRHRELLALALANRQTWPYQYSTREKFIDGLMDRKSSVLVDFEKLYSDLYKQAGWNWEIDTSQFGQGKLDDHTHVSVSNELTAEVSQSGSHGKALFFNSADLEDSHLLLYVEKDVKGKTVLKGDAKLRKDADAMITAWLKNQLITDNSSNFSSNSVIKTGSNSTALPGNDAIWTALLNYTKTINTHANDGEYNPNTVSAAESIKTKLESSLSAILKWEESSPEKPHPGGKGFLFPGSFVTAEQQNAWKNAAQYYLDAFAKVDSAKSQGLKLKNAFPGITPFSAQEYSPSAGLDTSGSPKLVGKWEGAEGVVEYWSDGNWISQTGGAKEKVSAEQGKNLKFGKKAVAVEDSTKSEMGGIPPQWVFDNGFSYTQLPNGSWKEFKNGKESGATVSQDDLAYLTENNPGAKYVAGNVDESDEAVIESPTGKVLKVIKRKASGSKGTYDVASATLHHSEGELTDPYTGYEYDVENADGSVVVEYRPWSEPGVAKSQQGLLRFSVKNWEGSKDQLEDVLETIQTMGVDLTPADEQSMELFYWRHMYGLLQDRKDRDNSKWSKTTKHIMDAWKANPDMDSSSELEMLREAWIKSFGKSVVEKADFMPKFSRSNIKQAASGFTSGKPYWLRPDYSLEQLKSQYGNTLPIHGISKFNSRILQILSSGGLYATEERLRLLGTWIEGMSSSEDQGKGSAGYLFTRQKLNADSYGAQVMLHPSVALRTSNYAFGSDHFGDVDARKNYAFFDMDQAASFTSGSNEMMVKNGISVVDDIAVIRFPNEELRAQAIKIMKDAGITTMHGLPIEQIFVVGDAASQQAIQAVWNQALSAEKQNG